jgi:hypothetical protein
MNMMIARRSAQFCATKLQDAFIADLFETTEIAAVRKYGEI